MSNKGGFQPGQDEMYIHIFSSGEAGQKMEMWKYLQQLILLTIICQVGFPGGSDSKKSTCPCRRPRFDPWVGKIPWRREWQPTLVFLPGKSHGQRSLAGCSRGRTMGLPELDMTELLNNNMSSNLLSGFTYRFSLVLLMTL